MSAASGPDPVAPSRRPATGATTEDEVDPERVAAAVRGVPDVAALHGGRFGEAASYLPGRRVTGVRDDGATVWVHVAVRWPVPIPVVADAVRCAATPHAGGRPVGVVVEDLVVPGEDTEQTEESS